MKGATLPMEGPLAPPITVTAVLATEAAARTLRAAVAGSGIEHHRISLRFEPATDSMVAHRGGAYVVSVDVRSARDRIRVEALMAAAGARQAAAPSGRRRPAATRPPWPNGDSPLQSRVASARRG